MNLARMMDCLDDDLCDRVIEFPGEYRRATTILDDGGQVNDIRTNDSCSLVGPLAREVHERINISVANWAKQLEKEYPEIAPCLYLPGVRVDFDSYREDFGLLRYRPGQKYDWHVDAPVERDQTGGSDATDRFLSVVVYLNDDFEGGETEMLGRRYIPKKGKALIFPSNWNYPHRACEVTKGTKYALVTWYHPD